MQPADNMEFRRAFANPFRCALVHFFKCECVRAWRIRVAAERTKLAVRDTNIRRIDMAIDVEIGYIPVALLAHMVREPAHRKQIQTYVRLMNLRVGLLLNFGAALMKDGIVRVVNNLPE